VQVELAMVFGMNSETVVCSMIVRIGVIVCLCCKQQIQAQIDGAGNFDLEKRTAAAESSWYVVELSNLLSIH
jgi:hypothetical protein